MSTTITEQVVPTGTWTLDKVHSTFEFAVRHSGVSLFKGGISDFDAELVDGTLRAAPTPPRITVNDENLQGHLLSPDFFDVERTPRVSFESTSIAPRRRQADRRGRAGDSRRHAARHPDRLDRRSRRGPGRREDRDHARDRHRPDDVRDHLEHGAPRRRLHPREPGHADREPGAGEGVMKILGISGSLRRDSHNRRLLLEAAELFPPGPSSSCTTA